MDKLLGVHERKAAKQKNSKRNPIKVVYISNPMKVKTSVSGFRALVQELTGRDAALPDPDKVLEVDGEDRPISDTTKICGNASRDDKVVDPTNDGSEIASGPFDEIFTPQMIENFAGLPSSLFFETLDEVNSLMRCRFE